MPLFSQDSAAGTIPADKISTLDKQVQDAGADVVNAKNDKGSATLSMGYAGARLSKAELAEKGTPSTEGAYVMSVMPGLPYFTSKVTFGKSGLEKERMVEATTALKKEIQSGLNYAATNKLA